MRFSFTCFNFSLFTIYPQALRSEPLLIKIQNSSLKICCTLSRLLQSSSSRSGLMGLQVFANFKMSSVYTVFTKSKGVHPDIYDPLSQPSFYRLLFSLLLMMFFLFCK